MCLFRENGNYLEIWNWWHFRESHYKLHDVHIIIELNRRCSWERVFFGEFTGLLALIVWFWAYAPFNFIQFDPNDSGTSSQEALCDFKKSSHGANIAYHTSNTYNMETLQTSVLVSVWRMLVPVRYVVPIYYPLYMKMCIMHKCYDIWGIFNFGAEQSSYMVRRGR